MWGTMSTASASGQESSLVDVPSHPVAYVAIIAALASAGIHLLLVPRVMGFSQLTGVLFVLNGVGWLAGTGVYLTRYWRREFYLVAAAYAAATILAFVAMEGRVNAMSIASKAVEVVVLAATLYLYRTEAE